VQPELCRPLVEFLDPRGRRVVEVGAGGGSLTRPLLDSGARVLALELDPEWAFSLRQVERRSALQIVLADALEIDWTLMPRGTLVAGNLPYQIATVLIERLLPLHDNIPLLAFLVQREVGERLAAQPGESSYGALSVIVNAYAEVRLLGRVRRSSFHPAPRVEGVFVGLRLRPPPLPAADMPALAATVRLAFGLRRKTLRNALAVSWGREEAEQTVLALGRGLRIRAEELPLESFVELHRLRTKAVK
jgi:16S rRNA (adenine1518-N6/adenine1519-N6)-dimethyltransferase